MISHLERKYNAPNFKNTTLKFIYSLNRINIIIEVILFNETFY